MLEPTLTLPQIELTYVPTQDLRPISLPGNQPKPSPTGDPAKPLPRSGADAFHPRQTILSQPVKITHPRQTLIQPEAPAAPPKMVPQMPNIAEWAATSPAPKPQLKIAPSVVAPKMQHRAVSDVAAPNVAAPERNAGPLNDRIISARKCATKIARESDDEFRAGSAQRARRRWSRSR